ncbi:uncharacterized protein [Haliotis asinina]|uniref:uncharacterized protein n=1 Tax=Haliotis asinina TaxID=109174 RepID=UPI003531DCD1
MSEDDNDCKNALHWACKGGHESMWECVLKQYGKSIRRVKIRLLIDAAFGGKKDLCEFLICIGANASGHIKGNSVLHFAVLGGDMNVVKYLLSQDNIDINCWGEAGMTPLMTSAMHGRRELFDFLVRMGANVSLVDDGGDNILHYASAYDESEIVRYIISEHIVDINSRGENGTTPLMTAAFHGHIAVLDLLVRNGGRTDIVDDNGRNILHWASSGGHLKTVKHILSQRLADINARDNNGETAAMIAKRERKSKVFQFLVSKGCLVK